MLLLPFQMSQFAEIVIANRIVRNVVSWKIRSRKICPDFANVMEDIPTNSVSDATLSSESKSVNVKTRFVCTADTKWLRSLATVRIGFWSVKFVLEMKTRLLSDSDFGFVKVVKSLLNLVYDLMNIIHVLGNVQIFHLAMNAKLWRWSILVWKPKCYVQFVCQPKPKTLQMSLVPKHVVCAMSSSKV